MTANVTAEQGRGIAAILADEWMRLAVEALNPADDEPEELCCESCSVTDADAYFRAFEAGETDDRVCDDCHHEHAALAASDAANRFAYYCR